MNVAFIPVRGGSKSIPLKNIKELNGKPLVYWTVNAAVQCKDIDWIYVATDSAEIRSTVEAFGFDRVQVIGRSAESASDTATTESAMLEFAASHDFDNIVLIQATSPLLRGEDLNRGFDAYHTAGTDSVLSVVRQKRFHWAIDENGFAHSTNYDVFHRPRRQEFAGYLVENGAFYITSRERLLHTKNRVSGKIRAVEMSEDTFFEIDEPGDWAIIEALMQKNRIVARADSLKIKMLLTDCDGCLTDGGMYYSENGDELKKFHTKDGMAFSILKRKGILTGMITGEKVNLNRRRAEKLALDEFHMGVKDKLSLVKQLAEKYGIHLSEIAYIGDDENDLAVIKAVGFGCCPHDAIPIVRESARYVANADGGHGVIREVVDLLYGRNET